VALDSSWNSLRVNAAEGSVHRSPSCHGSVVGDDTFRRMTAIATAKPLTPWRHDRDISSGVKKFPFQSITVECPLCANCAGIFPLEFFSVGLTNSWFTSIEPGAGDVRPGRSHPHTQSGIVGAYLIAGIRLAGKRQVNVRVVPIGKAVDESVDLAHEIYSRVLRRVPERVPEDRRH
jgi:hypothetical protein